MSGKKMKKLSNLELNRIRAKSERLIRDIRRKISAETAISLTNWDKKSTWAKLLRSV